MFLSSLRPFCRSRGLKRGRDLEGAGNSGAVLGAFSSGQLGAALDRVQQPEVPLFWHFFTFG